MVDLRGNSLSKNHYLTMLPDVSVFWKKAHKLKGLKGTFFPLLKNPVFIGCHVISKLFVQLSGEEKVAYYLAFSELLICRIKSSQFWGKINYFGRFVILSNTILTKAAPFCTFLRPFNVRRLGLLTSDRALA